MSAEPTLTTNTGSFTHPPGSASTSGTAAASGSITASATASASASHKAAVTASGSRSLSPAQSQSASASASTSETAIPTSPAGEKLQTLVLTFSWLLRGLNTSCLDSAGGVPALRPLRRWLDRAAAAALMRPAADSCLYGAAVSATLVAVASVADRSADVPAGDSSGDVNAVCASHRGA